jgi:predicted Zn-dependent peptidase
VDSIEAVTAQDVLNLAQKILDKDKMAVFVMGQVNPREIKKILR